MHDKQAAAWVVAPMSVFAYCAPLVIVGLARASTGLDGETTSPNSVRHHLSANAFSPRAARIRLTKRMKR